MDQIERITYFEKILDEGEDLVKNFDNLISKYESFLPRLKELETYYESETYRKDYKDDEDNKFPSDLKRGILSEDAIYDLLADMDEIIKTFEKLEK